MENLIVRGITMKLAGISYKVGKSSDTGVNVEDRYTIEKIEKESLHLLFEREVTLNFERKEILLIKVSVVRFANDGVDLTKEVSEDFINENIDDLLGPALSFMSALVAHITGSFGEIPLVTAPSFYEEEENNGDKEEK